jgi:hypothetical protein
MGPPGCGVRCGSAQLSSSVGRLAEAATAAPTPAVLKNDLRESMAGIVLWGVEKINHKGRLTTKDTKLNQPRITAKNANHCLQFVFIREIRG